MRKTLVVAVALLAVPWLALVALVMAVGAARAAGGADCGGRVVPVDVRGVRGAQLAARAAAEAGFTGRDLVVAVAVAGAESSYTPTVRNGIGASGLWQILERAHPDLFARYDWRDPAQNAAMAYSVWKVAGRSWTPWTTWTTGAYRAHLLEAQAAVATVLPQALSAGRKGSAARDAGASPADDCPSAVSGIPSPPGAFTGPDGLVADPTSSGRVTRRMLHVYDEVSSAFGWWRWGIGCWDPHIWNPTSDHPKGKACDFAVGRIGQRPDPTQRAVGWQLARWLQTNADALGVKYVIWDGHIWAAARASEGWRVYSGGGIYDPASVTGGHFDHVHCSVL